MKTKLLFVVLIISLFTGSCLFPLSSDPPPYKEEHDFKGKWKGMMEAIPSHETFNFEVEIISQTVYGQVTGTWQADFPDGKKEGTLKGTTQKLGINFGFKMPEGSCELSFSGNYESDVIRGVVENYQPKQCAGMAYSQGSLELRLSGN